MSEEKEAKLESEKMLEQIETMKAETKTVEAETPAKASEPTVETEAAPDKSGQAVGQVEAPTDKKEGKPEVDIRKWAEKKGIKDADAAYRSLRELEQKLSKTTAELKSKEDVPRGTFQPQYQPQGYQPQPQFQPTYQAPPYQPYPMDREKVIEQEAKRYNMAPEDFERVLSLSNDIAAMQTRKLKAEFDSQLQEIGKETRRNSELRELMQDPLFTNEKVQFEMHRVLEENPKAFAHEPSPYLYAFNEAQRRLARQYLEGSREPEGDGKSNLPTEPPKEGSKGSNPSFEKSKENALVDNFMKAKTAEEQRKVLTSLGAVQSN